MVRNFVFKRDSLTRRNVQMRSHKRSKLASRIEPCRSLVAWCCATNADGSDGLVAVDSIILLPTRRPCSGTSREALFSGAPGPTWQWHGLTDRADRTKRKPKVGVFLSNKIDELFLWKRFSANNPTTVSAVGTKTTTEQEEEEEFVLCGY